MTPEQAQEIINLANRLRMPIPPGDPIQAAVQLGRDRRLQAMLPPDLKAVVGSGDIYTQVGRPVAGPRPTGPQQQPPVPGFEGRLEGIFGGGTRAPSAISMGQPGGPGSIPGDLGVGGTALTPAPAVTEDTTEPTGLNAEWRNLIQQRNSGAITTQQYWSTVADIATMGILEAGDDPYERERWSSLLKEANDQEKLFYDRSRPTGGGAGTALGYAQLEQAERHFQQNLALQEAVLTGTYQGQPTYAASQAAQAREDALEKEERSIKQAFLKELMSAPFTPAGQEYRPGWEPGGAEEQLHQQAGLPFTPMRGTPFSNPNLLESFIPRVRR